MIIVGHTFQCGDPSQFEHMLQQILQAEQGLSVMDHIRDSNTVIDFNWIVFDYFHMLGFICILQLWELWASDDPFKNLTQ